MPSFLSWNMFCSFSDCIGKCISDHLECSFHLDVIAYARGGTAQLPCNSGVAVILAVKLMHQNQLFRRNSRSHGLLTENNLAGLGRSGLSWLRSGFELVV